MKRKGIAFVVLVVALSWIPVRAQSARVSIAVLVTELGVPLAGIPVQLIPTFAWQPTDAAGIAIFQASVSKGALADGSVYVVVVRSAWWMTIVEVPLGQPMIEFIKVHVETGPNLLQLLWPMSASR